MDEREQQPIELWNINGRPTLVRIGPRIMADARLAECRAQQAEAEAADLRAELDRQQRKELYDRVIARFNRVHGQKPKTSLAQICAEMGVSYEAVKKHRQRKTKSKS